jgi:hypothetical protein
MRSSSFSMRKRLFGAGVGGAGEGYSGCGRSFFGFIFELRNQRGWVK